MRMTKCKPHIFVLTLAGAEDRRGPLVKQLDDQRLSYELFFGIDGRSGLPAEYENLIDRQSAQENLGRPMSDPEFACALSHNKIYQKIIEREISCAIILEDDVTISDQLVPFFDSIPDPPCDMLLLGYSKGRFSRRKVANVGDGLRMHKILLAPYGTTGYMVTSFAACWFAKVSHKISYVADWPFDITAIDSRAVVPRLVEHSQIAEDLSVVQTSRSQVRAKKSVKRFLAVSYWKRWWIKRFGLKIA